MGITYGDHLIDSGYRDITPEQEREIEAREECKRRGLKPDDDVAYDVSVWMVVDEELRSQIHCAVNKEREKAMNGLSRSIQRLRCIIEQDFPPVLASAEVDLLEHHLATLRRA